MLIRLYLLLLIQGIYLNDYNKSDRLNHQILNLKEDYKLSTSLFRTNKNFSLIAFFQSQTNFILQIVEMKIENEKLFLNYQEKKLDNSDKNDLRMISRGNKELKNFILFLGFNNQKKRFFFQLRDFSDSTFFVNFKNFHNIYSNYILQLLMNQKYKDESAFYNVQNVKFISTFKDKNDFNIFVTIFYFENSNFALYLELNLYDATIKKEKLIKLGKKADIGSTSIKLSPLYFIIKSYNEFHIYTVNYFFKNIDKINFSENQLEFGNFSVDDFNYVSDDLFVIIDKKNFIWMKIKMEGEIVKNFYSNPSEFECEDPFLTVITSDYVGCVFLEENINGRFFKFFIYYYDFNKMSIPNEYSLKVKENFYFSKSNFSFKEDYFKKYIIIVMNEHGFVFFYKKTMKNKIDLVKQKNTEMHNFYIFNRIIHNIDIFDQFPEDFAKLELIQNRKDLKISQTKTESYKFFSHSMTPNLLLGFSMKFNENKSYHNIILSLYNFNFLYKKLKTSEQFKKSSGEIYKDKILSKKYFFDKIFIEYENSYGYFQFSKTRNFVELDLLPSNFEIFAPINFTINTQFFIGLKKDRVEIYENEKLVFSKFYKDLNEEITPPFLYYTYDENLKNYFYVLKSNLQLYIIEIIHSDFFSLNIYPVILNQLLLSNNSVVFFENYRNLLIIMIENNLKKGNNNSFHSFYILKTDILSPPYYEIVYNQKIKYDFCDKHFFSIFKYFNSKKNGIKINANFVFCVKEETGKENLYYMNLNKNEEFVPILLDIDISKEGFSQFIIGKGRSKTYEDLSDNLLIYKESEFKEEKKITKNGYLEIVEIYEKPSIKYYMKNEKDYRDDFETYLLFKVNSEIKKVKKLSIKKECLSYDKDDLSLKKFDPKDVFKHSKNAKIKQINIFYEPQKVFQGNLFNLNLKLNNQLENHFRIFSSPDLLKEIKNINLIDSTFDVILSKLYFFENNLYYFKNSERGKIFSYNLLKNETLIFEELMPNKKIRDLIVVSKDIFLIIDRNNNILFFIPNSEVPLLKKPDLKKSKEDEKNDKFEKSFDGKYFIIGKFPIKFEFITYKIISYGNLFLVLFRRYNNQSNYSYIMVFEINNSTNEIILQNPHNIKINFIKVSLIKDSKWIILCLLKSEFSLIFFFFHRKNPSFPGFKNIVQLDKYFLNKEIIDNYSKNIIFSTLNCHLSEPIDNKKIINCLNNYPENDAFKIQILLTETKKFNWPKLTCFDIKLIRNDYFKKNKKITLYGGRINDNFLIRFFIVDGNLEIYFYQYNIMFPQKNNLKIKPFDFCSRNINNYYLSSIQKLVYPNIISLKYFHIENNTLTIITAVKFYQIKLKNTMNFVFYKKNLKSNMIIIKSSNLKNESSYFLSLKELDEELILTKGKREIFKIFFIFFIPLIWVGVFIWLFLKDDEYSRKKEMKKKKEK